MIRVAILLNAAAMSMTGWLGWRASQFFGHDKVLLICSVGMWVAAAAFFAAFLVGAGKSGGGPAVRIILLSSLLLVSLGAGVTAWSIDWLRL